VIITAINHVKKGVALRNSHQSNKPLMLYISTVFLCKILLVDSTPRGSKDLKAILRPFHMIFHKMASDKRNLLWTPPEGKMLSSAAMASDSFEPCPYQWSQVLFKILGSSTYHSTYHSDSPELFQKCSWLHSWPYTSHLLPYIENYFIIQRMTNIVLVNLTVFGLWVTKIMKILGPQIFSGFFLMEIMQGQSLHQFVT
jgi:hypothetical protein